MRHALPSTHAHAPSLSSVTQTFFAIEYVFLDPLSLQALETPTVPRHAAPTTHCHPRPPHGPPVHGCRTAALRLLLRGGGHSPGQGARGAHRRPAPRRRLPGFEAVPALGHGQHDVMRCGGLTACCGRRWRQVVTAGFEAARAAWCDRDALLGAGGCQRGGTEARGGSRQHVSGKSVKLAP